MPATAPPSTRPSLPAATLDRLHDYVALLQAWTRKINLVASAEAGELWFRHIEDSLRLLPLVPPGISHAIDLGSGAGLPGLVLAVASGVPFHLIESDRRKAAFLAEAQRITAAPVSVHCTRIEAAAVPPAPLITARALARLPALLDLAAPLLAPGGVCLFPKGRGVSGELAEVGRRWRMRTRTVPDPARPDSVILVVSELARA